MKKLVIFLFLISICAYGQCLSSPISTRVGIKLGFNICTYDPGAGGEKYSGAGMHFGLGMGTDILRLLAIDMTPQFRSTNYSRDETFGKRSFAYSNLYFPLTLSLKGGMIPLISPYLGLGLGINIQFGGTERFEFTNGTAVESSLQGSNTLAFLILGFGAEVKLTKFRISPEFTANIQGQKDDNAPQYVDYHISVGCYYAP